MPAQVIYTVVDDSGDIGTTSIDVPSAFSLSQFTEFGAAMATLLDAILAGKVTGAQICFAVDISGVSGIPAAANANREAKSQFNLTSAAGFPVQINVPGTSESFVVAGTDELDQTDPDVAAFAAMLTSGLAVTGGTIIPSDVGESDLASLDSAREAFFSSGTRR